MMCAALVFLTSEAIAGALLGWVWIVGGVGIFLVVYVIAKRKG
jgi:hypothetical protein